MAAADSRYDDTPRLGYLPGLDGLRGVAVAVVVLFHAGHLDGGYLGVDLFFVLSGYLITSLLVMEGTASGGIGLVRFWGRRARRLLPALGVLLVGVGAYALFVAEPEELNRIRWDGLATMFYVANWREVFAAADYWALFTAPSPLDHTWSLAIEEQFYVLWPLVVLAVLSIVGIVHRRRGMTASERTPLAAALFVVCVAGAAVALGLQAFWQWRSGWDRVYYGTDTRAFALLCGAALACWTTRRRGGRPAGTAGSRHARVALEVVGVAGAAFLVFAFVSMAGDTHLVSHGGLALCSLSGAAVIAAVAHPEPLWLTRVLSLRPLVWLGLVSYGVYLYHWPIDVWLSAERLGLDGWSVLIIQWSVTLAVSVLSYIVIEQPIRHRRGWTRTTAVTVPAVGFGLLAALLVVVTIDRMPGTVDDSDAALERAAATLDGRPVVLIVGDSVGYSLAREGFSELEDEYGIRSVNRSKPGCEYPSVARLRSADGEVEDVPASLRCGTSWIKVAEAYRPAYVVFARTGIRPVDYLVDGEFVDACSNPFQDRYRDELTAAIGDFAELDATTVLVTSLAPLRLPGTAAEEQAAYERSNRCGTDVVREVAAANPEDTVLVDVEMKLCDGEEDGCTNRWNGVRLRPDALHFKGDGARLVAEWVLDSVDVAAGR